MSSVSNWSTTAGNNNSASPDGFPENMAPSGVNNSEREVMAQVRTERENTEWFDWGLTPTYISTTSFSLAGDKTTKWHVGRRVKLTDASTLYATILTSAYTSLTTITLTMDSGSVSASLSAAELGALSETNDSLPDKVLKDTATQTVTNKSIDSDNNTITNIVNADIKAAAAIDASKIGGGGVSTTEYDYLGGVTSDIQTQIDTKQAQIVFTAGDYVYAEHLSQQPASGTMSLMRKWKLPSGGALRTHIYLTTDGTSVDARIYKNGVAEGTARTTGTSGDWSEDLSGWAAGDIIEIWGAFVGGTSYSVSCYIKNGTTGFFGYYRA